VSRAALLLAAITLLPGGCASAWQRLGDGAGPPRMTPSADPTRDPKYRPVSLPMPPPPPAAPYANSLWRSGGRAFFPDQRAAHVGDIVTVVVNIIDTAVLANQTQTTRAGNEAMAVPNMFGLETIHKLLPKAGGNMVATNSTDTNNGNASINRSETITLRVAGVITQELPNGNFVVVARQQVRVNSELRELQVSGVVRPQDIASDNTVLHDRMAEARISYGGRGIMTDVQQPRYGQQMLDILLPF
jgi:flagellar L-ring protein precursor FlgH